MPVSSSYQRRIAASQNVLQLQQMMGQLGATGEEECRDGPMRDVEARPYEIENPQSHTPGPNSSGPAREDQDRPDEPEPGFLPPIPQLPIIPGQLFRFVLDSPGPPACAPKKAHPQLRMNKFWSNFQPEYYGGVVQILPESLVRSSRTKVKGAIRPNKPGNSYQSARDQCIKSVKRIIRECHALNQKYTDNHFDIEKDLKLQRDLDCLVGLLPSDNLDVLPQDVKRVTEICEKPTFFKNGATFDDIVQGSSSLDCWFLSALSALTANQQLIENLCVIRDEEIGVYGFVFYRDGEWQPCIIDDKLYLKAPSFDESWDVILGNYAVEHRDQEKKYRETFQTGSKALFFGACRDENETWVPLYEKAFAKAHGDYDALCWGATGEALEDLTGGVSTELYTHNILNKDRFWTDTLSHIGKDYLFSCSTAPWLDLRQTEYRDEHEDREARRKGVVSRHAYAVLATYEGFGERLIKLRNPWGKQEWSGAWSDGSKEWTSEWLARLQHNFGDDGVFWISYEDFLHRYKYLDHTRIFGPEWHVAQQWTHVQVPWNIRDYQQTRFAINVSAATEVVLVLSQLDGRYFRGLQGAYDYTLQFRLQQDDDGNEDDDEDDYIIRSKLNYNMQRSTNVTLDLEPGKYILLFKVEAFERHRPDVETVIRNNIHRKNKITQMATLYDLARAKGRRPRPAEPEALKVVVADTNTNSQSTQTGSNDPVPKEATPGIQGAVEPLVGASGASANEGCNVTKPAPQTIKDKVENKSDDDKKPPHPNSKDEKTPQDEHVQKETQAPIPPVSTCFGSDRGDESDNEDDPQRNPWNAFCTVGLRVYSKLDDLKIDVVYPEENPAPTLDGDDIAKAALTEATVEEKNESKDEKEGPQSGEQNEKEEIKNGDHTEKGGNKSGSQIGKEEINTEEQEKKSDEIQVDEHKEGESEIKKE